MSVLTNNEIKAMIDEGEIVMHPRHDGQINNGSVDVSLGRYVYRIQRYYWTDRAMQKIGDQGLKTLNVSKMTGSEFFYLDDLRNTGDVLRLARGERVLAHTHEFIGSRHKTLPEMRAKSTMARWGLTVCACAGWGDVGFFNRWAMEILNMNPGPVEIPLGTLVAQVVFHKVSEPEEGTRYNQPGAGTYQQGDSLNELVRTWSPTQLLPKAMKAVPFQALNEADERPASLLHPNW